jgi:hypothetical protein
MLEKLLAAFERSGNWPFLEEQFGAVYTDVSRPPLPTLLVKTDPARRRLAAPSVAAARCTAE